MRRVFQTILVLIGTLVLFTAQADEKNQKEVKQKKDPRASWIPVYLGHSDMDSGLISKPMFDSLLVQGWYSRDTSGKEFKVTGFMLTFCERMIYEDSAGNIMPVTDYLSEYCFDSKLKPHQEDALLRRAKRGDTVIFEDIRLESIDSVKRPAHGHPMKLIITR